MLLATGWTDYAFSSDNVAAHQRGLELRPAGARGPGRTAEWRTVESIGYSVGRPQTLAVDLDGKLRAGRTAVRDPDQHADLLGSDPGRPSAVSCAIRVTRLDPVEADLRWRGFSAEMSPDGREPFTYDYERVSRVSPWKTMTGRYTREGDVRELLQRVDDMFVIARPGDEIALSFDARALPPLAAGRTRTFLLYADGFSKEMDIMSASPHTVEPLPFHGMRSYPYRPDATIPGDRRAPGLSDPLQYARRLAKRAASRDQRSTPIDSATRRMRA